MKTFTILLSLLFFSSLECRKFRTGKFEVESKNFGKVILDRNNFFQTETIVKSGIVAQYKIKWTSDCNFILFDGKLLKGKELIDPILVADIGNDTLFNEIISIDGNKYRVKSRFKNSQDWNESINEKIE